MARKKKQVKKDIKEAHITKTDVAEVLETNYMPYTMSVIVSRALPEIDGLKPAHRKLLYTMYKMGLLKGNKTKSANIVGTTMRLNPHGDCLRGDTKVYLASGDTKTIKELFEEGKSVEVKAVDNDKIVNAKAHSFRIGQYTEHIHKIYIKNGTVIETTSNHPFLTEDGEWVQAKNLSVYDRLYVVDTETLEKVRTRVEKIVVVKTEIEPMYDFTVDEYENLFIDADGSLVCVHNSSIYDTMVRLARGNESLLHPYVESKGNFGKVYSKDSAAASRYTEAKLEKIMEEFFRDIDSNAVDFVDNYDNTTKEPLLLPVTFPSILTNPNMGIAVGMASNICSFNLEEICDATIAVLNEQTSRKAEKVDTEKLLSILKGPDFSTGGAIVYNKDTMKQIYETGRGSFNIRAHYEYNKQMNRIEIYEIPYTTTVDAIIDSITDLVKSNQIKELTDIRDATGKDGMAIHLDLKRNTDPEQLMEKLYLTTPLQNSFSCNFNLIIEGHPLTLGVKSILENWINFRVTSVRRRLEMELEKNKHKLHMLEALEKVLLDLDKAVKIVKDTPKDKDVIANLMKYFKIDEEQATYVADIKLRNFNKEYILNKTKARAHTEKEISKLEKTVSKEANIKKLIIQELEDVKEKYKQPRKSKIVSEKKVKIADTEELFVDDYNVKVFVTNDGYIKKVALTSMRGAGDNKLKEGDFVKYEMDTTNKSDILVFTSQRNVYKIKTYDLEDMKLSQFGDYLPNIVKLNKGEEILYVLSTADYTGSLIIGFENGKVARIKLKSYDTKQNRKQLKNAYSKSSNVVRMYHVPEDEDIEIALLSSIDKLLIANTSRINVNGSKTSQGVGVMKGAKSDTNFKVLKILNLDEMKLTDEDYYRVKGSTAAVGKFLKSEDKIL